MKIKKIHYLLFIFIAVKLFFFLTKYHFIEWDEAVYLGLGKYFYSLGRVGLLENIRPPMLSILLGALWKLNLNYILLADLLELFFSLGCIYLTYRISNFYFSENKSFLAALIFAITPFFFYNSLKIMTEIPSTFFVLLATYFFLRKKYSLVGLFLGVSFLFKYPYGIMLPAFLLILFFNCALEKDFRLFLLNSFEIVILFLLTVTPLFIFNYFSYADAFQPLLDAAYHSSNLNYKVGNIFLDVLFFPIYLFANNLLLLFFVPAIYYFIRLKRFIFLFLIFVPLIYFTTIINKQLRFATVFLPFLAIMSAYAIFYIYNRIKSLRTHKTIFFFLMLIFVLIVGVIDFVEYDRFPSAKPKVVDEFYSFFPDNFSGSVLTSDPVFVVYTDLKLLPYYNGEPNSTYDKYVSSSAAIVYTPNAFPCFNDTFCELSKSDLERKISSNTLLFSKKYDETKYIYLNKNISLVS